RGDRPRRDAPDRRERDGDRPARIRIPRDRGPHCRRRNDDRPHLPSRPRLRAHRGQAFGARRVDTAGRNVTSADLSAQDLARAPLGRPNRHPDRYAADLLFTVPRAPQREALGIRGALPFTGADVWTAYELTWLDESGKPQIALATLNVPAESPSIVE